MHLAYPEKSTILIVDDNLHNLNILASALKAYGFEPSVAQSGEETLELLNHSTPDLILLDVMMPGMDGFETCRHLKENPATRAIPVIFVTALADIESKLKAFEAGGVDYVSKPLEFQEVLAPVATHLTLRDLQQQLEQKNNALQEKNLQLQEALDKVKTLRGLLPICANCKKIRDDGGYWQQVEAYIADHSEAEFTHGICPACMEKLYSDLYSEPDSL
jgi:DNA-binding response OmpR family regulator